MFSFREIVTHILCFKHPYILRVGQARKTKKSKSQDFKIAIKIKPIDAANSDKVLWTFQATLNTMASKQFFSFFFEKFSKSQDFKISIKSNQSTQLPRIKFCRRFRPPTTRWHKKLFFEKNFKSQDFIIAIKKRDGKSIVHCRFLLIHQKLRHFYSHDVWFFEILVKN